MVIKKSLPLDELSNVDSDPINKTCLHPLEIGVYYYGLHEKQKFWNENPIFNTHTAQGFRSDGARWRVMSYMDERYESDINEDYDSRGKKPDTAYEETLKYPEVKEIAEDMKNFYLSRFTEKKLINSEDFNSFQNALYDYLSRPNQGHFFNNEIGLISTLPHSYESDMEFLRASKDCDTSIQAINSFKNPNSLFTTDDKRVGNISSTATIVGAYQAPSVKPRWRTALLCRDEKTDVMLNLYMERSSYHDLVIDVLKKSPRIYVQASQGFIIRRDGNYSINVFDMVLKLVQ